METKTDTSDTKSQGWSWKWKRSGAGLACFVVVFVLLMIILEALVGRIPTFLEYVALFFFADPASKYISNLLFPKQNPELDSGPDSWAVLDPLYHPISVDLPDGRTLELPSVESCIFKEILNQEKTHDSARTATDLIMEEIRDRLNLS